MTASPSSEAGPRARAQPAEQGLTVSTRPRSSHEEQPVRRLWGVCLSHQVCAVSFPESLSCHTLGIRHVGSSEDHTGLEPLPLML